MRWKRFQSSRVDSPQDDTTKLSREGKSTAPYTSAEKAWLKCAFGSEYKFLVKYGLRIFYESHREEGRDIARALIESEAAKYDDDEGLGEEDDEENELLRSSTFMELAEIPPGFARNSMPGDAEVPIARLTARERAQIMPATRYISWFVQRGTARSAPTTDFRADKYVFRNIVI